MQPLHILAYSIFAIGTIALAIDAIRHRFKTIEDDANDFAEGDDVWLAEMCRRAGRDSSFHEPEAR